MLRIGYLGAYLKGLCSIVDVRRLMRKDYIHLYDVFIKQLGWIESSWKPLNERNVKSKCTLFKDTFRRPLLSLAVAVY